MLDPRTEDFLKVIGVDGRGVSIACQFRWLGQVERSIADLLVLILGAEPRKMVEDGAWKRLTPRGLWFWAIARSRIR
jgi:hypothetical protein